MKNNLLKSLAISLLLLVFPMKQHGQSFQASNQPSVIEFDITKIDLFEERIFFAYHLLEDYRFNVILGEQDGVFLISADESQEGLPLQEAFTEFSTGNALAFSKMDKVQAAEVTNELKGQMPKEVVASLMMDYYAKSRQNNLCANADPFCTDNGLYQFPAGVNAGSGESGPDYGCLSTKPNPAWYYMRIGNPGNINIYMYSTPSEDIDFCCWGPFDDPTSPCPNGLTSAKIVSCSYSPNATETCAIPSSAQTGKYYILIITNYSNHSCNISFQKQSGTGTTDCGIMPPLVENGGPYCVGETIQLSGNAQAGATYSWTGPGGWTATGQNVTRPNCTMAMAGTYTCTISVGTATNSADTQVQIFAQPTANFNYTSVCKGNPTQFTSTCTTNPSGQQITSYQWNFGDGQSSTQQSPTHTYASPGNYTVTLNVSCGNGQCTSTKTQTVPVYAEPVANAGNDQNVVYGGTVTLTGSGGVGTFNYHWEPANMVTNPNSQITQTVALTANQTYTLTVTNPQGNCSSTDQVTVHIEGSNMTATASATPSSICLGETSQLRAQAGGGTGNYSYMWSPTTGLSAPNTATPTAQPTQTTTYTCQVSDGITTQNVSATVTVNMPEHSEETVYICPDEIYDFYGQPCQAEGDYIHETTTLQGCEKTITLHLHHYPTYENGHTDFVSICPGESYNFHGQSHNMSGMYPATLESMHGCDSVVWLSLTVYPANDTILVDPTICTSQTYNFHGTLYDQDGQIAYFDTTDNHGCLLVEKLVLSVGPYQIPPMQNEYICYEHNSNPEFYWDKTNQIYTQDTYDEIILPDPNGGCDIKYRLNLQFHEKFYDKEYVSTCDQYYWSVTGQTYYETNHNIVHTFEDIVNPEFVCEGKYILDLTIDDSSESEIWRDNQCDSYDWQFGWNNEIYTFTTGGDYTKTIETNWGCDSTVTLHLGLDYTPDFPQVEGKSWVVGGSEFQYTIEKYWVDIDPRSTHSTTWSIEGPNHSSFNKWDYVPFGPNNDSCLLYIYTFELDTIQLVARTNSAFCGTFEHSKPIICGYHGTEEHLLPIQAEVYPNPNDGDMTLSFDHMLGDVTVKVYDMTGTMVDRIQVYNGFERQTHPYHCGHLSKGVYFFSFTSREGTITKKVIIMD